MNVFLVADGVTSTIEADCRVSDAGDAGKCEVPLSETGDEGGDSIASSLGLDGGVDGGLSIVCLFCAGFQLFWRAGVN